MSKMCSYFALLAMVYCPISEKTANAQDTETLDGLTPESNAWKVFRGKVRMRTFTEYMTPAFDNHENAVPFEDGTKLLPTNAFNVAWLDYEVAKDTKILYYQRFNLNFADTGSAGGFSAVPRNPRLALRKVNVFNIPNLTTTYDFYTQPGLAPESDKAGRNLEFGFRTATSYSFPGSRWSMGVTTELTFALAFNQAPPDTSNAYGWLLPWASYDLSTVFSTQHYLTASFQHVRGTFGIQPDYPMPLTLQNGIGINITQDIWTAVFINNYLNTTPNLSNTWASVWLSLNLL